MQKKSYLPKFRKVEGSSFSSLIQLVQSFHVRFVKLEIKHLKKY